jgi:hypothetical protein
MSLRCDSGALDQCVPWKERPMDAWCIHRAVVLSYVYPIFPKIG